MARFQLDHNVSRQIADLLRFRGHDVVTARELGLEDAADDVHLLAAIQDGRIFVTHNRADFVLLHYAWRRWTRVWRLTQPHSGILVVPQPPHLPPAEVANELNHIQAGVSLVDELYEYEWQTRRAWVRLPDP